MWRCCLVTLVSLVMVASACAQEALWVAAGAGYRRPVLQLLEAFSQATGIPAQASFGNMQQVRIQAQENQNMALVVGDRVFLEPMGLFERYQPLGWGQLVLVTAKGQAIQSLQDLKDPRFVRIALADQAKAVYGHAAATCLQRMGLLPGLADRMLEVATVPQVAAYVATGEVSAGFVNRTEAIAQKDRTGAQIDAPQSCYDPIELSVGIVKGQDDKASVRAFSEFLKSPAARNILAQHGM